MSKQVPPEHDREQLIRAYKTILRDVIERRPSGLRLKIASAIGRNKSFVSQITSPNYPIPIPRIHLDSIFDLVHFTPEEKAKFLQYYDRAHPRVDARMPGPAPTAPEGRRVMWLELPRLGSALDTHVDRLVRDFARCVTDLLTRRK